MKFSDKDAKLIFTVKAVESIPCELRGQVIAFDAEGVRISDDLITPWPMPWIENELTELANDETMIPEESSFRVYNTEEPDQYVFVEVKRL